MAVYFQPQYKPWWADLANTALKEGLSGLMKGMFERDAAARTKNRYNKEWAQAWEGYGGQPTGAQSTSAQQPAAMSIESAPEVRGIGQIANPASMQSATGNDALGAALKTQGITVPKEYLPNGNDGLLGTSIKANLANNYVQSQMPSREEFIRRLGMVMSPQNMELALKQADYMMGPRWKVDDQIYKGRQMENILGALPGMQDKEGNRNYNNRAYMYGMDNLATGNLNFINPEYNRWFTEAENQRQRAFTGRENALNRGTQMAIARMNDARMRQIANMRVAGGGTSMALPKGLSWKDINKMVADAIPRIAGKSASDAELTGRRLYGQAWPFVKSQIGTGTGDLTYTDAFGTEQKGVNPFAETAAPSAATATATKTPAYTPGSISVQGSAPQRVTYDALGLSGAGAPGGIPAPSAPAATGAPTAGTGAIPRSAVEAFMKQSGITDYKTAEAALMRGIQNY